MNHPTDVDDKIAIILSCLCLAHYLAEPVLRHMSGAPIDWTPSDQTRIILTGLVTFYGIAAVASDRLRHCNSRIQLMMVPGILLVWASIFCGLGGMTEQIEIMLATLGNVAVIFAHVQNIKLIAAHEALTCIPDGEPVSVQSEQYV